MVSGVTRCLVVVVYSLLFVGPNGASSETLASHSPFKVAVYIPAGQVARMGDLQYRASSWGAIRSQLHVDKVYLEVFRSGVLASDQLLEDEKAYFRSQGVQVAGAIAYSYSGDTVGFDGTQQPAGPFTSFCYTDPRQLELVKKAAEVAARHFDEVILDDFFFSSTKRESDIAAKGEMDWTPFRLRLMNQVARDFVLKPARNVNPGVKVIIKFPNWYEHYQHNGYDLEGEPANFDGIYIGTETRDPDAADQHLQQYQSYELVRYLGHVAPGRNGGGWVDVYDTKYLDRYAEQLWDTLFAKAPEIMLFQYSDLLRPAAVGNRKAWSRLGTTFDVAELGKRYAKTQPLGRVTNAAAAGYALSKVSRVVGGLGEPIGIASYKPVHSEGEDFLQNYLGMIGIPIEMYPQFPKEAHTILLTEQAKYDPKIVAEIAEHLRAGGNIVITARLLKALESAGIKQITDAKNTGNALRVDRWVSRYGQRAGIDTESLAPFLVPEISFPTTDASALVQGIANGHSAPVLLENRYANGTLYVLTIPENMNDLYLMPQQVLTDIRSTLMDGFPVRMDAPAKLSLFAYDNKAFIVESFRDSVSEIKISARASALRNMVSGEVIRSVPRSRLDPSAPEQHAFRVQIPPHSFVAYVAE